MKVSGECVDVCVVFVWKWVEILNKCVEVCGDCESV